MNVTWFNTLDALLAYESTLEEYFPAIQAVSRHQEVSGFCDICNVPTNFIVCSGARLGERPNLREGLQCTHCKLTARQRSLLIAIRDVLSPISANHSGLLLESGTRLERKLRQISPQLITSEFLSPNHSPGQNYLWWPPGRPWRAGFCRHESITALSFADGCLDFIVHTDVLEHVENTIQALNECRRALKPGGSMVFTVPFFTQLPESLVRGRTGHDGVLEEFLPSEYHGDGTHGRGIYTFHNFGRDFFTLLRDSFTEARIGIMHSVEHGLMQMDPEPGPWNMLPLVFHVRH